LATPTMTTPVQIAASLTMVALVLCVIYFGLLPAVLTGTVLFICIRHLEEHLPAQVPNRRIAGLAISVIAFALVIAGIGFLSTRFLGHEGLVGLMLKVSNILEQLRAIVPEPWLDYMPETVDQLKNVIAGHLKTHAAAITQTSMHGFHQVVHILLATIIACLLGAAAPMQPEGSYAVALSAHINKFREAVAKVYGAQIKVALINTAITGTFLLGVLPLLGYSVPFADVATVLTFIFGLIPVVGNLLSNTINVILALSVGPWIAVACLVFLIISHKIEYLLCAKYVGQGIGAKTWELLAAMLTMEAIFGPIGFAAAPVFYAWIKDELRSRGLV